jgi:hypothetical protein
MPIKVSETSGGAIRPSVFLVQPRQVIQVKVDVSALSNTQVDADGYLKRGTVLTINGVVPPAATAHRTGIVIEDVKLGETYAEAIAATDPFIALGMDGVANRDVMEDNLERALTTDEIDALNNSSFITLTLT